MNASTRLAALPELPTAGMKRPRSFFSRQFVRKAARSVGRILTRIPTAPRKFTAASAVVMNGGGGTETPAARPVGEAASASTRFALFGSYGAPRVRGAQFITRGMV